MGSFGNIYFLRVDLRAMNHLRGQSARLQVWLVVSSEDQPEVPFASCSHLPFLLLPCSGCSMCVKCGTFLKVLSINPGVLIRPGSLQSAHKVTVQKKNIALMGDPFLV
jgi:hypothetical protein